MSGSLEIRVLGPVEIRSGERVHPLHRLQVRQVLALLAARPGQTLGADELVEQLWASALPAHPRRALQVAISRLRSTLGEHGEMVQASGSTYSLDTDETDLIWFDKSLEKARVAHDPATAVSALEDALALWRGTPFADAKGPPLLEQVSRELHEARLLVVTLLAEALVVVGRTEQAVMVGRRWFESEPHRERLAVSVARALAAEGRKTEALRVLTQMRNALRDQMGVDPSAAIADLEHEILVGSVDLATTPTVEVNAPHAPFVGRLRQLVSLTDAAGKRASMIIVGEAGMGKSTLLEHAESALRGRGRRVITIRVDPEPIRPLAPVADLVEVLVQQFGAEPESDLGVAAVGLLVCDRRVVSEPPPRVNREDLVVELSTFIANAAGAADAPVVIDDLHLVDAVSAAIFEEVIGSGKCTVLVGTRPGAESYLQRLLTGQTPATVVELAPLDSAAVFEYLDKRYSGRQNVTKTTELRQQSGGNPLFLSLLVDLDLEGAIQPGSLPTSIMVAVRSRLDSLASRAIETLQLASAVGTRFSLVTLRKLCSSVDTDIRDAEEARLVVRYDADHAAFVHGVVAEAAYQMLSHGHRVEVHDALGQVLEADGASATEYVSHYSAAAPLDPFRGAIANLEAGRIFAEANSLEVAAHHFASGLGILEVHGAGESAMAVDLMVWLGRTQRLVANPEHVTTLVRAARLARRIDESEPYARAVIELCSHGGTTKAGTSDAETLGLIDDVLTRPLSAAIRAELLASASALTALSNQYRQGQRLFHEALDIARPSGEPSLEARVLVHAHLGLSNPADFELRESIADRLEDVAGNDVDLHWEVSLLRFWQAFVEANTEKMGSSMSSMRELTPRAHHRHLSLAHVETAYAHVLGDLENAEALLNEAHEMGLAMFPESWATAHYSGMIFAIRDCQGRLPELREEVDRFVEALPEFHNWRVGQALIAAEVGDLDVAAEIVAGLAPNGFELLARDLSWTAALALLCRVVARLDDTASAAVLYRMLAEHHGRMSWGGTCTFGPNDSSLALLAAMLGKHELAAMHVQAADALTERLTGARSGGR